MRDYLIPWFVPQLRDIGIVAGRGATTVKPMFDEFRRLFLFAHLERIYHRRAWVLVDGDEVGEDVRAMLGAEYQDWPSEHFHCLTLPAVEHYYPDAFRERYVESASSLTKDALRTEKTVILRDLMNWLDNNEDEGKEALRQCTAEVIEFLEWVASGIGPDEV